MRIHLPRKQTGSGRKQASLRLLLLCSIGSLLLGMLLTLGFLFIRLDRDGLSVLQAVSTIRSRFVGDYEWHEVVDASLNQMVQSLGDRWSYFLTKDAYEKVLEKRSNSYVGIGVTVQHQEDNGIDILFVSENSPADRAGIHPGDSIRKVEDVAVTKETWQQCFDAMEGEAGSSVRLELQDSTGMLRSISVVREEILTNPVSYELMDGNIGLVKINNFYSGSGAAMISAVDALVTQGAQSIVFDLRDNPGGYVTELTKMLDHLLPEGVVFRSENLQGDEQSYTSDAAKIDLPFSVLVNADSYSAAEFFAAQLRESTGAFISGETTSGKGYAQQLFPLRNGSALGLSTSRYFTGAGVSLIGVGIVPDAQATLNDDRHLLLKQGKLAHQDDPQLQAAVKHLQEKS